MTILFLVYGLVHSSTDGRVTSARYFAESLARHSDVLFLSTGPTRRAWTERGVRYDVVRTGDGFGFLRSLWRLHEFIAKERPHVVQYHPPAGFNLLNVVYLVLLWLFCRIRRTPLSVYLWGGPTQVLPFWRWFDRLISPTPEPGSEWVPPVVDTRTFNPGKRRASKPGPRRVLFMTGARTYTSDVFDYLLHVRGLADFIEASKALPKAEFVVSVPCLRSGAGRSALTHYLEAQRAGRNVRVMGTADAPRELASADVYVFPYQREEPLFLPVSLVESFASGTPLIACDLAYIRKIVKDRQTGLLYPAGDGAALAGRIRELLERPAFRASIIRRGLVEARKYSPESSTAKLYSILASMRRR